MKPTVWPQWKKWCPWWEGVTLYGYLDTKGKVTCGIGFLIDSVQSMLKFTWYRLDGGVATRAEVETEWNRVKAHTDWKKFNGLNYRWRESAKLFLRRPQVDEFLLEETNRYEARLKKTFTNFDAAPAPVQLALIDYSWQNGPGFLDSKASDGSYVWENTRAAVLSGDWKAAAEAVPGSGDRHNFRQKLFLEGAITSTPDEIWFPNNPPIPPTPPPDPPTPPDQETGAFDMAAAKERYGTCGKDYDVPANKDTFIQINDKGDTSVVVGDSGGVDIQMTVLLEVTQEAWVWFYPVVVEADVSGGGNAKDKTVRAAGRILVPRGSGVELSSTFKGSIPKLDNSKRNCRLRWRIRSNTPGVKVTLAQYSGWEM